jgi:predicted RND superfamily exporter protein
VIGFIERVLFGNRRKVLSLFALITIGLGYFAVGVHPDASFDKLLPSHNPYIDTYKKVETQFGGGNVLLISLEAKHGTIFTPQYFDALRRLTDDVFFLPGVDRTHVSSLYTPDTRFAEVVEGGFNGGPVIPATFKPDAKGFDTVRSNIFKAGIVGRLVGNNFRSAVVSAHLNDIDPATGAHLDYTKFANDLDNIIRAKYNNANTSIHILGFAQAIGDIERGAQVIVLFFGIALAVAAVLLYIVSRSLYLTVAALACSLIAVMWQLGIITALGIGIDPISVLIPFLILAIGVSHGVQIALSNVRLVGEGKTSLEAARGSFHNLLEPGVVALALAVLTFVTVTTIPVPAIRELALTAAIGIAVLAVTNLLVLPVIASFARVSMKRVEAAQRGAAVFEGFWRPLASLIAPRWAIVICLLTVAVAGGAFLLGQPVVGDLHVGVPELRPDSRNNQDALFFQNNYSVGVDMLEVLAEGPANSCLDYDSVKRIDDLDNRLQGLPGVRSTLFMGHLMRLVNVQYNEGNPKFNYLPHDSRVLGRDSSAFEPSVGLSNNDCSAMPLIIFLTDHKAGTIDHVIKTIEAYAASPTKTKLRLELAAGTAGVIGATNMVVEQAQLPMLGLVYGMIIVICLGVFRSLRAAICIVLPLAAVSILANAAMTVLGIGLKLSTLPVTALGVGIGVDYGIYKFSRLSYYMRRGYTLNAAYIQTLRETGSAVIFTGLSLSIGVATWSFSPLQFQADMGMLLTFMFFMNMAGAIVVLPAIIGVMDLIVPQKHPGDIAAALEPEHEGEAPLQPPASRGKKKAAGKRGRAAELLAQRFPEPVPHDFSPAPDPEPDPTTDAPREFEPLNDEDAILRPQDIAAALNLRDGEDLKRQLEQPPGGEPRR